MIYKLTHPIHFSKMQTDETSAEGKKEEKKEEKEGEKEGDKKEEKKDSPKKPKNKVKTIDLPITAFVASLNKENMNLFVEKEVREEQLTFSNPSFKLVRDKKYKVY